MTRPATDDPIEILTARFARAMEAAFGAGHAGADPQLRPAQNPRFGDFQANAALALAKPLGRSPREVAAAIVAGLDLAGIAEAPAIAGPGFINLRLTARFLGEVLSARARDERLGVPRVDRPLRVVIDYSSPNAAKEMHVGHLRSAILGDCLVRLHAFLGHDVVRQNHLGDWGTQFGMLLERLVETGTRGARIADLNAFYKEAKRRFDDDEDFAARARRRVVLLQSGDPASRELWRALIDESLVHMREAYSELGVLLSDEDVRGESAYNHLLARVVDDLVGRGLAVETRGAIGVFVPGVTGKDGEPVPLIVRKSDGGFGYAATDLAAIRFRTRDLRADLAIYVVDARQKGHFEQVFWVAREAGWWPAEGARHVVFGMILGEDGTPLKTREGENVRLAELLGEAVQRAREIVDRKNPEMPADERVRIAHAVGIGAVKYSDLACDRNRNYEFSWDRMLAFEGNTAPYLQYAYARIRSILRKSDAEPGTSIAIAEEAERGLALELSQFPSVVRSAARQLDPSRLSTYLHGVAAAYSTFYERCPVLKADDPARASRLALCELTARTIARGLELLGIEVVERM